MKSTLDRCALNSSRGVCLLWLWSKGCLPQPLPVLKVGVMSAARTLVRTGANQVQELFTYYSRNGGPHAGQQGAPHMHVLVCICSKGGLKVCRSNGLLGYSATNVWKSGGQFPEDAHYVHDPIGVAGNQA